MQLQVKLHGLPPASTLNARIRRQLTKLEQRHREIDTCRVSIDRRATEHGAAERYVVTLEVAAGRQRVQIEGEPSADIGVALRDAFEQAHLALLARKSQALPAGELEDDEIEIADSGPH